MPALKTFFFWKKVNPFFLFMVSISFLILHNLNALQVTVADCSIILTSQENSIIKKFAQTLKKEDYKKESQFYQHLSQKNLVVRAVLLKRNKEIFVLVPTSILSLGSAYMLTIMDIKTNQKFQETNLKMINRTSLISVFQLPYSHKYNQLPFWDIENSLENDSNISPLPSSLRIVTTQDNMPTIKKNKGKLKYHLLGSIVLGKTLSPTGFLIYDEGFIRQVLFEEILLLINTIPHTASYSRDTNKSQNLIETAKKFSYEITQENINAIGEFFSHTCLYQFGLQSYFYLRSLPKIQHTVTVQDLKKSGLVPFKKALSSLMILNNKKKDGGIQFRTIVSLPENPRKKSAIVTFSVNQNIIITRWKWYETGWKIDNLPLPMKDLVLLASTQQYDIDFIETPFKPFSGLSTGIGTDFFPKQNIPSFFIGYYKNFSKYLSLNINLSHDPIFYHRCYKIADNQVKINGFSAYFLSLKPSFVLHYPIVIKNQFYIMPYFGLELASAFLLSPISSAHPVFDKLLIKRVPLTLLIGWTTGIEVGINPKMPMSLGLHFGYQQDFFGQQTVRKDHEESSFLTGSVEQYYVFLYYKIALSLTPK